MARDFDEAHDPQSKATTSRPDIHFINLFMALDFEGKNRIFPANGYDFPKNSVSLPL